jgi:ubiquinone/menaquinone biosynthesis C-methylase UbiE
MKKKVQEYYSIRARTYSDLDEPATIVSAVRSIGVSDHLSIISPSDNDLILDIGCGTGRFLKAFSNSKVVGVDLTLNMLEKARGLAPLVKADAEYLPFKSNSFDIVHSAGLLGIYRSGKILEEAARVVKNKGKIYFSFPAATSISGIVALIFKKLLHYNPTLLDYWYTEREIKALYPSDVKVVRIYRLGWEPPFQRWYKRLRSKKLIRLFLFLEENLRDKPFFKYFGARFLVEGEKTSENSR